MKSWRHCAVDQRGRLLVIALVLCAALLPVSTAMIASLALRNERLGNTYTYSMYSGAAVNGESFVTGATTYPYVFDSSTNQFVVRLLAGYLAFVNQSVADVGGSLKACMGSRGTDTTGTKCYKALLAAAAPSDCPSPNALCCPLFWRVGGQNIETTMAQMDVETIFWNGAYAINGFYANFSREYLMENGNCSKPLSTTTEELSLAVDVTGEWRFVPLTTTYLLQETVMSGNASESAKYFAGTNPQDALDAMEVAQRPFYRVIDKYLYPVVVCAALLIVTGFFLVLACGCGTLRSASRVRRTQLRLIELKSAPAPRGSMAILQDISPESSISSSSSSERSRRSKRQGRAGIEGGSGGSASDDDADGVTASRSHHSKGNDTASTKSKASSKSLKSKTSAASCKASAKKTNAADFPQPPAPLPGIRPRTNSTHPDDAPSRAASAQLAKRSSSTGTVVHQVGVPPRSSSSHKR